MASFRKRGANWFYRYVGADGRQLGSTVARPPQTVMRTARAASPPVRSSTRSFDTAQSPRNHYDHGTHRPANGSGW